MDISHTDPAPFRSKDGLDAYFDISGAETTIRFAKQYELGIMEKAGLLTQSLQSAGWVIRGVIREDDGGTIAGVRKQEPMDDPFFATNRFCNHFFDPVVVRNGDFRGYTGFCFLQTSISDAVQWSLGRDQPFNPQSAEQVDRRNHFTVLDAREAMWRALTLRDRANNPLPAAVGIYTFAPEDLRRAYWATTFRALGDVIHTVQDMAQPQHTRNEGHATQSSGYEEYLDARARRAAEYKIDGQTLSVDKRQLPDLNYVSYPIPRFRRYSDYWSTEVSTGVIWGLADYSNRGFFTLESNIGNSTYPKPIPAASNYTTAWTPDAVGPYGSYLLFGNVDDDVLVSTEGATMATKSVINSNFTLSKRNYDDRAALLIPRATAYSSGLIDYFFRGKMEISLPDSGVYAILDHTDFAAASLPPTDPLGFKGFGTVRMKLRNVTPYIAAPNANYSQDMGAGTLVAIAKFHRNTCYKDDLTGEPGANGNSVGCRSAAEEIVVSQPKPVPSVPSTAKEFEFTFDQQIPINATDLYLQVVFRGALGDEADAVVVSTQDLSEPTYLTFMNATDYFAIGGHPVYCATVTQGCGSGREIDASFQFYPQGASGPAGARIGMRIPVQQVTRVALLTDAQPDPQHIYDKAGVPPIQFDFGPSANELNSLSDGSTFQWDSPVHLARGIYFGRTMYIWLVNTDGTLASPSDQVPYGDMTVPVADTHPVEITLDIPLMTP